MSPQTGDLLLRRCFTADLQHAFARLSGDFNPMHVDPVAARRTLAGGQVVHGIHLALAAMEAALAHAQKQGLPIRAIAGFTALFRRPILLGDTVDFHLTKVTSTDAQVAGRFRADNACLITIRWGDSPVRTQIEPPPLRPESVTEIQFTELADRIGEIEIGLNAALAGEMFPLTTCTLGSFGVAEVLALSRLVGMHCPGLNSIFNQCAVNFREPTGPAPLHYRVIETDERFAKLVMQVNSPGMEGQITAFYRPPPQPQPGMVEVQRLVAPGSFADSIALVVGGSRGLGEITARVIAAGGGLPIISYYQGQSDAERIAVEIRAAGGRCEVLPFDIQQIPPLIHLLTQKNLVPRSLYYYATPKISGRPSGFFDYDALHEFHEVYVTAFGHLIDAVASSSHTPLRVFYPSTVAVTKSMRESAEYAMAKRAGEELCAFYNRYSKQVKITVERLPRIRTDQTSTLLPVAAEDSLAVMLPLVHGMETPI